MVSRMRANRHQKGFTLIELLIVVTIVGLLAGIAVIQVRFAQRKAAENVLKANLTNMRKAIDDHFADKQRYPGSLQDLVPNYLRRIPVDPITKSADTWIEVQDDGGLSDPGSFDSGWDSNDWESDPGGPGVIDVKSGAEGETMDEPPIPYGEL
ncbi:MAG TPA: prepilin-type N-terminal cleavage/methylation domain-containing protein [Thermoanaerobaculia bacterium]|nr:prepilin-type N-terminal cleavage/methylation domain-containing protein [Thermoanaerobaculia bacterium]